MFHFRPLQVQRQSGESPHHPSAVSPGPSICFDDEEGGGVVSRWRRAKAKQRSSSTEANEDGDTTEGHQRAAKEKREQKDEHTGRAPKRRRSQTGSPPSWLFHTQALERNGERGPCDGGVTELEGGAASTTNVRILTTTHPDGTQFFYRYKPTPQVAEALSNFKIPDDLVRWSVRYLGSSDGSKKTS
ncbi:hypothetical protein GJAV_G00064230 [Gymnothorax javanicus]|nr:hypothetical protein GJAV_G00064230 [Gymnothorax javanicus]